MRLLKGCGLDAGMSGKPAGDLSQVNQVHEVLMLQPEY
jgi:hypothetical protein